VDDEKKVLISEQGEQQRACPLLKGLLHIRKRNNPLTWEKRGGLSGVIIPGEREKEL